MNIQWVLSPLKFFLKKNPPPPPPNIEETLIDSSVEVSSLHTQQFQIGMGSPIKFTKSTEVTWIIEPVDKNATIEGQYEHDGNWYDFVCSANNLIQDTTIQHVYDVSIIPHVAAVWNKSNYEFYVYYSGVSSRISIKINNAVTSPVNVTNITNYINPAIATNSLITDTAICDYIANTTIHINPAIATNSLITDTAIPIMQPGSVVKVYGNTSPASIYGERYGYELIGLYGMTQTVNDLTDANMTLSKIFMFTGKCLHVSYSFHIRDGNGSPYTWTCDGNMFKQASDVVNIDKHLNLVIEDKQQEPLFNFPSELKSGVYRNIYISSGTPNIYWYDDFDSRVDKNIMITATIPDAYFQLDLYYTMIDIKNIVNPNLVYEYRITSVA